MRAKQRSQGIRAVDVRADVPAGAASALRRTRGRVALALILLAAAPAPRAPAQQPQRLAISVASSLQAEPASRVRLPIQIGPPEALQKNSFVRIRGLPPAAALSEGHAIAPGSWAVPLIALPTLSVILPAGVQGQSDVAISLMSIDGGQLAEARMLLVVAPTLKAPGVTLLPPAESERAPDLHEKCIEQREPGSAGQVMSAADQQRAQRAMIKGNEQLEAGNVAAARQLYKFAADAGLAQAAMALAATYDPDELAKLNVVGLVPDIKAAHRWYGRARELGCGK